MKTKTLLCVIILHLNLFEAFSHSLLRLRSVAAPALTDENTEYGYNFQTHNTFETIQNYLIELSNANKPFTELQIVRYTSEGRPIYALHIGNTKKKPLNILECSMHAREWTAVETCIYFISQLVRQEESLTENIISMYDFIVMPLMNPDGYIYTLTDPMWRKNRDCVSKTCEKGCIGVDTNRNFPTPNTEFCVEDGFSSRDPCAETFCGVTPLSANESLAIRDILQQQNQGRTLAFFSVHSAAGMWLIPEANDAAYQELKRVADIATNAMFTKTGYVAYKAGKVSELLYKTTGNSDFYAMTEFNVKYCYTIEMRETIENLVGSPDAVPRFRLKSEAEILPVTSEMFHGIRAAILAMQPATKALKLSKPKNRSLKKSTNNKSL